jgi:hypothetical protein
MIFFLLHSILPLKGKRKCITKYPAENAQHQVKSLSQTRGAVKWYLLSQNTKQKDKN